MEIDLINNADFIFGIRTPESVKDFLGCFCEKKGIPTLETKLDYKNYKIIKK